MNSIIYKSNSKDYPDLIVIQRSGCGNFTLLEDITNGEEYFLSPSELENNFEKVITNTDNISNLI